MHSSLQHAIERVERPGKAKRRRTEKRGFKGGGSRRSLRGGLKGYLRGGLRWGLRGAPQRSRKLTSNKCNGQREVLTVATHREQTLVLH